MALNWLGMSQVWVANLPLIQVFPPQDKHGIALINNMAMCVKYSNMAANTWSGSYSVFRW